MNLVSEAFINRLNLNHYISRASFKLVGVTGVPLQTLGVLRRADIEINGTLFKVDFVVTSKMNEDCILGQSFFEEHKMILDFNTKTISNCQIQARLTERPPRDQKLLLKCTEGNLISCLKTVECQLENEDGCVVNHSGVYFLSPDPELSLITDSEECSPVYIENGFAEIALSCDQLAEVWLPKHCTLGTVLPDVLAANLVETCTDLPENHADGVRKQYGWQDNDPRRIEMIIEALGFDCNENLNSEEKEEAKKLIAEFPDVFALDRSELGCTDMALHQIPLTSDVPVQASYRRVPFHLRSECIKEIQEMLDAGIIQHSTSNYNSPAIVLHRKGKTRIILDFRDLNAISSRSYCSVPAINTLTAGCFGKKIFSNLDVKDGFLSVPIEPSHRRFTSFSLPGVGFFEFVRMSLGLQGGPSTFQNLLDRLLANLEPSTASWYVDDILSASDDVMGMIANLRTIFQRIRVSKLRFNPAKCHLFQKKIRFLGMYISKEGVEPDGEKCRSIIDMSLPRTKKQVQKFIGAASWFRPHIKDFSRLIMGLTDTLKGEKFRMTEEAIESIRLIKEALVNPPVLCFPSADHEFVVMTDASAYCIGGTIGHMIDNTFRPVAYGSKILTETEQRYASYKREFLALKYFINHWRYYLLSKHFTVIVDMKALTYSSFMKKTNCSVILRWILSLADFDFTIQYKEGRLMDLPDLLSRLPSKSDDLYSWWVKRCSTADDQCDSIKERKPNMTPEESVFSQSAVQIEEYEKPCEEKSVCKPNSTYQIESDDLTRLFSTSGFYSEELHDVKDPIQDKGQEVDKLDSSQSSNSTDLSADVEQNSLNTETLQTRFNYKDLTSQLEVLPASADDGIHETTTKDETDVLDFMQAPLLSKEEGQVIQTVGTSDIEPSTVSHGQEDLQPAEPDLATGILPPPDEEDGSQLNETSEVQEIPSSVGQDSIGQEEKDSTLKTGSFDSPLPAYSSRIVLEAQLKDPDLMEVRKWLISGKKPDEDNCRSAFSKDLNHYWHLNSHLNLSKEGAVCFKYFFHNSKKFRELLCVPQCMVETLIKNHHDSEHSGHLGPIKTLHRIREKYYFPVMKKIIATYCQTCELCFLNNHGYQKKPGCPLRLFTANRPGEYLSIDLIGPINGPCRFRYIFTMKDRFTKFVQLEPLLDGSAQRIAKTLLNSYIWKYGVPELLLSDRAQNLTGEVMSSLLKILSVYRLKTTSYHARGNGDCERANKDIAIILKKLVADNPTSWPTKLNQVAFAINSSVNATTKFSPFHLQFGRDLRSPSDLMFDTTTTVEYKSGAHLGKAMFYQLRETFDLVRANLSQNQAIQKMGYDKKKSFHTTYKEGDLVLVWKPLSPSIKDYRKFKNCYSGPWRIVKVLSPWTYLVEHLKHPTKQCVVHFDTMKIIPANLRTKSQVTDNSIDTEPPKDQSNNQPKDEDLTKIMFGTTTTQELPALDPPEEESDEKQSDENEQVRDDSQIENELNVQPAVQDPENDSRESGYNLRVRQPITYSK